MQKKQQDLIQINANIKAIQQKLSKDKTKQSKATESLKNSEVAIGHLSQRISGLSSQLKQQQTNIHSLKQSQQGYLSQMEKQRHALAEQLRAAYLLERQGSLSVYFDSKETEDMSRYLHYYTALNKAQLQAITQLQSTIDALNHNVQQIHQSTQKLQSLYQEMQTKQKQAKQQEYARQAALRKINHEIDTNQKRLKTLLSDQSHLANIIRQFKATGSTQNFALAKHTLTWPTHGSIIAHFGHVMPEGDVHWQGDLIKSTLGAPIHAIFGGRVVYSGWLKGYGLLLIVDHGHGYMSLYARNHSLYKQVGDTVKRGEMIATVGQSGGFDRAALYFEIRHNGMVVNPGIWCKKWTLS